MARGGNTDAFVQRGCRSLFLSGDAADEQARVQRAGLHRAFGGLNKKPRRSDTPGALSFAGTNAEETKACSRGAGCAPPETRPVRRNVSVLAGGGKGGVKQIETKKPDADFSGRHQ